MMNQKISFQREGAVSNAHEGKKFEITAKSFFYEQGIELEENFGLELGLGDIKKTHAFDLGNPKEKIIIECKSHRWTKGNNIPSAKLTVWTEAMYFFSLTPNGYRKIFFVLRDFSQKETKHLLNII